MINNKFEEGLENAMSDDDDDGSVKYEWNQQEITTGNVGGVEMRGLSVCTAAVFIVGEIAGAGVLALPAAVNATGWIGLILIVFICLASVYTGGVLGKAWLLVQQRYPEYRGQIRYPYPAIGQVTFGRTGRIIVSAAINFTLFGASVVFLILAAENIRDLLSHHVSLHFCYILLIVAAILAPLTWLGTPKDFWFVGIGAMLATSVACCILFANMVIDIPNHRSPPRHDNPSFDSFAGAFGIIVFAFGGHPAFPTFQTDMKVQKKFAHSVAIAYMSVLMVYMPVAMAGYFIYGSNITDNVLLTMPKGPMLIAVESLITMHILFAFVIVINPVCQDLEELLKTPTKFTWRRMVYRSLIVAVVLFFAETIPKFGAILSLIGGSTTVLLAYVLPQVFYMKLCSMDGDWPKVHTPLHWTVVNYEIMFVGVLGGLAATYSAIVTLTSPASLTLPCFVNSSAH